MLQTEHKETDHLTRILISGNAGQNHNNGAVTAATVSNDGEQKDGPTEAGTAASESPAAKEPRPEQDTAANEGTNPEPSPDYADMAFGGMNPAAESEKQEENRPAKPEKRRLVNLTRSALGLWRSMVDLARLLEIGLGHIAGAAREAMALGDLPLAEEVSTDEKLLKKLFLTALAWRWGFVLRISALTDREPILEAAKEKPTDAVKSIGVIAGLPSEAELEAKEVTRQAKIAALRAEENWQKASAANACRSMQEIARLINHGNYEEYADRIETGIEAMTTELESAEASQLAKDAVIFAAIQALVLGVARTRDARLHVTRVAEMLGVIEETPATGAKHEIMLPREMEDGSREGFAFKSMGSFASKVIDMLRRFSDEVDEN